MIKVRQRSRTWLAAPAAVVTAVLGLAVPAQAQPARPSPPASTPVTTTQSLQSLIGHAPAGGKRWIVNDPVAYGQAVKSKKWVSTPSGLSYTGCVFRVPDHATVKNGLITLPSGAKHQLKPCEYPTLATPGSAKASVAEPSAIRPGPTEATTGGTAPVGQACVWPTGGVWWAASCYESQPDWATSMTQEYGVPTDPAKDGALIFIWGGMEDASGDTLLQDVLTWGANGTIVTNPNIWYVTPWYLWSNNSVIGASIHVGVADTIVTGLTASNCNSSGACTWALTADDTTNGRSTSYTITSGVSFQLIMGSVLEIPGNNACDELPTNGHAAFRDLVLVGNNGTITPNFGASTPDAHCSVSITQASNGGDILWKA